MGAGLITFDIRAATFVLFRWKYEKLTAFLIKCLLLF